MTLLAIPVPAPGFHANPGSYPDKLPPETQLRVQFSYGYTNGQEVGYIDDKHTYTPAQLKWARKGLSWEVAAVAVVS
jgi:hypothetical protein